MTGRLAGEIVEGLRSGALTAKAARAEVEAAGFGDSLHISESAAEMAEQLASVVRAGNNVWADCSPPESAAYLRFWVDKSHPRIA